MRRLDFADGAFDLIWREDAIYNVGVEAGLRAISPQRHSAVMMVMQHPSMAEWTTLLPLIQKVIQIPRRRTQVWRNE